LSYEESYYVEDQIICGSDLKPWIELTCVGMVQVICSRYNGNEDNTFDGRAPNAVTNSKVFKFFDILNLSLGKAIL
jgi:hypothetical protein